MDTPLFDGKLVHSQRIIYTPSPFARSNLVHLQEVGRLQARSPHASTRKGLASYLFFMVESGSGTLEYDGTTRACAPGTAHFLTAASRTAIIRARTCGSCAGCIFTARTWAPSTKSTRSAAVSQVSAPRMQPPMPRCWKPCIRWQIPTIMCATCRYVKAVGPADPADAGSWHPEAVRAGSAKRQNLQEIKDYLDAHYGEKITLDALAEQFYINKFYLTRVFKEQFGQTVTGYLMQLRITQAKRLLRFSDKNIEVIAQECGMSDANYFSRIFKKVEGTTPGQYRRQW